jgi:hypothetical protein
MRVAPVAACATKSTGVSNYRYTATAGIPCAMVLTGSFVLFLVTGLFCHHHSQSARARSRTLAPASGRQNHTTSPSALRLRSSCATHASTASRPNVRDDREAPLLWERDAWMIVLIWGVGQYPSGCGRLARRAICAWVHALRSGPSTTHAMSYSARGICGSSRANVRVGSKSAILAILTVGQSRLALPDSNRRRWCVWCRVPVASHPSSYSGCRI